MIQKMMNNFYIACSSDKYFGCMDMWVKYIVNVGMLYLKFFKNMATAIFKITLVACILLLSNSAGL